MEHTYYSSTIVPQVKIMIIHVATIDSMHAKKVLMVFPAAYRAQVL